MKMIENLKLNDQNLSDYTVCESTDGGSNQYFCGTTLYFLSYISSKYDITIYRMISAPSHRKNIIDGIST